MTKMYQGLMFAFLNLFLEHKHDSVMTVDNIAVILPLLSWPCYEMPSASHQELTECYVMTPAEGKYNAPREIYESLLYKDMFSH